MNDDTVLASHMLAKRVTLSARQRYVLREVLQFMEQKASSLNAEGRCLIDLTRKELRELREQL